MDAYGEDAIKEFQSTLPPRGVTDPEYQRIAASIISIHTPTKGSDGNFAQKIAYYQIKSKQFYHKLPHILLSNIQFKFL